MAALTTLRPVREELSMNLGFETCGNATLIVYDGGVPVLVTDPWIKGAQYFRVLEAAVSVYCATGGGICRGPTGLAAPMDIPPPPPITSTLESLAAFRDKTLLLPRHHGGRILHDLNAAGYQVRELANDGWLQVLPQVRILCCADWNQDAALLIALGDQCASPESERWLRARHPRNPARPAPTVQAPVRAQAL